LEREKDILLSMLKLKLLFALLFMLAIQQVYPSNCEGVKGIVLKEDANVQSQFEESNFQGMDFGDLTSGQVVITGFSANTEYALPKFKSKDFQAELFFTAKKGNLFLTRTSSLSSLCYRVIFIPIFLQTGNFLL